METYTVFVSSPSDVKKERDSLYEVIDEVNTTHGAPFNYQLKLWQYENEARPSAQKPQDLINSILPAYQIFIGIMWKRFGTPTPTAGSGTEEEYNNAYKAWQEKNVIDILFYFSQKLYKLATPKETSQLNKVNKFRKKLSGQSFVWNYDNPGDFKDQIRKHLCMLMNGVIQRKSNPEQSKGIPDRTAANLIKQNWNSMSPDLQRLLSVPYNENRMQGNGGIKTADLFAAMVTSPTPELEAVIKHIPKEALPQPIEGKLIDTPYITEEQPWLSHCVSSSIIRLSKALSTGKQMTSLDVFTDIARNGNGQSVQLLRQHDITPDIIEKILQEEKLSPLQAM